MKKISTTIAVSLAIGAKAVGQTGWKTDSLAQDSIMDQTLQRVTVKASPNKKSRLRVTNTEIIGQGELIRAACWNFGTSTSLAASMVAASSMTTLTTLPTFSCRLKSLAISGIAPSTLVVRI